MVSSLNFEHEVLTPQGFQKIKVMKATVKKGRENDTSNQRLYTQIDWSFAAGIRQHLCNSQHYVNIISSSSEAVYGWVNCDIFVMNMGGEP